MNQPFGNVSESQVNHVRGWQILVVGGAFLTASWAWALDKVADSVNVATPVEISAPTIEYRQFGKVEITGSSIVNPRAREALPVRIIDKKEIERSGATDLAQLLSQVSVMHSERETGGINPSGTGGYVSGAIHGYEAGTLVLINGRRLPAVPQQRADLDRTTSDIGFLLLSAVDRIEILSDGASSIYGSDAIAGVINIITREEVRGMEIQAGRTWFSDKGGDQKNLNLTWGKGRLMQDGFSVQAYVNVQKTQAIAVTDRGYTNPNKSLVVGNDANGKPLTFTPAVTEYALPGKPLRDTETATDCTGNFFYAKKYCQMATYSGLDLYPSGDTRRAHLQFNRLTNTGQTQFLEASYQDQTYAYARSVSNNYKFSLDDTNKGIANLNWFAPVDRSEAHKVQRIVLGQKGEWNDWDYNLSFNHGVHHFLSQDDGGLSLNTKAQWDALIPTRLASQLLEPVSAYSSELLGILNGQRLPSRQVNEYESSQQGLQWLGSRTVGETAHGDIKMAISAFMLRQTFHAYSYLYPSLQPEDSGQRRDMGLASEVQVPLLEKLETQFSARAEKYNDFGSVLTHKLGAKYQWSEKMYFRASTGTGFRAPTLSEMSPVATWVLTSSKYDVFAKGNPALKPEQSSQQLLGMHMTPGPQWALGVDYWRMHVSDTFGSWSVNQILNDPTLVNRYYSIQSNGNGRYDLVTLNMGEMYKSGLDYYVHFRWPLASGRIVSQWYGTYNLQSMRNARPNTPLTSDLAYYNPDLNSLTPRHRLRWQTSYESVQLSFSMALNYQSGNNENYPNSSLLDANGNAVGAQYIHRVGHTLTLDTGGWYELRPGLRLNWFVRNLTNAQPPVRYMADDVSNGAGSLYPFSDTRYNDYRGRSLQLSLIWRL